MEEALLGEETWGGLRQAGELFPHRRPWCCRQSQFLASGHFPFLSPRILFCSTPASPVRISQSLLKFMSTSW